MKSKVKYTIIVNPKYERLRPFLEQIPITFNDMGSIVYEDRNLIKKIFTPDGTLINVKRYHEPNGINKYVYSLGIRKPKGMRAFSYPQILLKKGIETPEPIAYIEERIYGLLGYSYFISIQCPYEHSMFDVGNAPIGTYEELAIAFARFTANMHEKEVMHMDYSPGNILYQRQSDGAYNFSLVDINRMYFGPVCCKQGLLNFKRLWGPKRFFVMMIEAYSQARGYDINTSVAFSLDARKRFWRRYCKKHGVYFKLEL